jgi:hypothetical protein
MYIEPFPPNRRIAARIESIAGPLIAQRLWPPVDLKTVSVAQHAPRPVAPIGGAGVGAVTPVSLGAIAPLAESTGGRCFVRQPATDVADATMIAHTAILMMRIRLLQESRWRSTGRGGKTAATGHYNSSARRPSALDWLRLLEGAGLVTEFAGRPQRQRSESQCPDSRRS